MKLSKPMGTIFGLRWMGRRRCRFFDKDITTKFTASSIFAPQMISLWFSGEATCYAARNNRSSFVHHIESVAEPVFEPLVQIRLLTSEAVAISGYSLFQCCRISSGGLGRSQVISETASTPPGRKIGLQTWIPFAKPML
jgi:hypothetical protein